MVPSAAPTKSPQLRPAFGAIATDWLPPVKARSLNYRQRLGGLRLLRRQTVAGAAVVLARRTTTLTNERGESRVLDAVYHLVSKAKHPAVRMALDYWLQQRNQAERPLPGRQHFDPLHMRPLLQNVVLFDIVRTGVHCRFRHRLAGTHLQQIFGRDLTGMFIEHCNDLDRFADVYARYAMVADDKVAAYGVAPSPAKDGGFFRYEHLTLPLATDGQLVDMLFGVRCILPDDAPLQPGYATAPLAESPHHRVLWDLRLYVACHKHGAFLLNTCTCSEREPIGWRHLPLEQCQKCDESLARVEPTDAVPDDLAASVLVHQLLSGEITSLRPEWAGWHVGPQLNKFWDLRSARGLRNARKRDKLLYSSGA